MKLCPGCTARENRPILKPISEFYRRKASKDGLSNRCKECEKDAHKAYHKANRTKQIHRRSNLKVLYNLTIEQFNEMFERQEGGCGICTRVGQKLVIDHDHKTGKVRGLLCAKCNHGLGRFDDDPVKLQNAIMYLEMNK